MPIDVRRLQPGEECVLDNVSDDVFDDPIVAASAKGFLSDRLHHLVVAIDGDVVVGFASGVHYFHPDKPTPEFFVNEVGVASTYQGQGLAKRLMAALLDSAMEVGCLQAWVLTDKHNTAAVRLYESTGGKPASGELVMFDFDLSAIESVRLSESTTDATACGIWYSPDYHSGR